MAESHPNPQPEKRACSSRSSVRSLCKTRDKRGPHSRGELDEPGSFCSLRRGKLRLYTSFSDGYGTTEAVRFPFAE